MVGSDVVESVAEAIERALADVGVAEPYEFAAKTHALLIKNLPLLDGLRSPEALRRFLSEFPSDLEIYAPAIIGLLTLMPTIIQKDLTKIISLVAKDHPIEATAGRRRDFDGATMRV